LVRVLAQVCVRRQMAAAAAKASNARAEGSGMTLPESWRLVDDVSLELSACVAMDAPDGTFAPRIVAQRKLRGR
jgi:hypothetical protein